MWLLPLEPNLSLLVQQMQGQGPILTFKRIFRFVSDSKWMQRSITFMAIWICTGSGGSILGPGSGSVAEGGSKCSSVEKTNPGTVLLHGALH